MVGLFVISPYVQLKKTRLILAYYQFLLLNFGYGFITHHFSIPSGTHGFILTPAFLYSRVWQIDNKRLWKWLDISFYLPCA